MSAEQVSGRLRSGLPTETQLERDADLQQGPTAKDYERRWWTLGVLCISLVMIVMANASLNVALPTLAEDLRTGSSGLQWIVDAYSLVFAGLLLTAGSLGDRYGRRLALNGGLVVFGAASLVAALSSSAGAVVASRAVMGAGAAFVMPATLSILAHVFPPAERPRAIAIWAGFAGVGVAMGGVVSGALLEAFWWGSIFLINVVVVVVALVAGFFLIPRSREKIHAPLDPLGAVLSIAGLASLVYGIIEGPENGWTSTETLVTFAIAAVVLLAFVWWELRASEPMLDLGYFRNPRFTAATTAISLVFFAMFGSYFLFTQYLQLVHGYDALSAGVRILPWALAYLLSATQSAKLVERFGQRWVVASGLTIAGLGIALLAITSSVTASYWWFAIAVVVQALGMGITTAPSTGAIMRSLPLHKAGVGSAVNDTTRELGGALGVAVLGSLVASQFRSSMDGMVGDLPARASSSLADALQAAAAAGGEQGQHLALVARTAFVDAFTSTLWVAAVVVVVASFLVGWLLRPSATARADAMVAEEEASTPPVDAPA
ncbi:MFS transporter [Dermatobacter hominis]|uniref:MFS transporter n=1 Tax=Dermatobacter hominis TaxID=2884263 RepID=UPI001D123D4C|nr:MFS transporter [Dermatobacter hominis]UDY34982.1 MFS transporter [Dermatobacter hominis]